MPFFSVVIPSYNHANQLAECIGSVQSQDSGDWEMIIIDDSSTDRSLAVAQQAAQADTRIAVVAHEKNVGLHLARRTGVAATTGKFVLFLDADDALEPGTLSALRTVAVQQYSQEDGSAHLMHTPHRPSIIHFGLRSVAVDSSEEEAAQGFARWANTEFPPLDRDALLRAMFGKKHGDKRKDWNVHHRLFAGELCREAFAAMSEERLERAEDSYEMFVLAALSGGEITRNDIVGYRYTMGSGVTSARELSAEEAVRSAWHIAQCARAAREYAQLSHEGLLAECAQSMWKLLAESAMNEWYERVPEGEKFDSIPLMAQALGNGITAAALMRFARDRAYAVIKGAVDYSGNHAESFFQAAQKLAMQETQVESLPSDYGDLKEAAQDHIDEMKREMTLELKRREQVKQWKSQQIRIFVSTHKNVDLFDSAILQPVQVGSQTAAQRFNWAWHDDEGDNISSLNPEYSELTTQYWAWKNVDAEYYGFCHYRRYFDFSTAEHKENAYGEVMADRIGAQTAAEFAINDAAITASVSGWDIITSPLTDMNVNLEGVGDPCTQWQKSPLLVDADFERLIAIVRKHSPEYVPDLDIFLNGHRACFCNMFIMRRELFQEYCAWLFPLLEEYMRETDMTHYSVEARRTPGHLSERLLNVFLIHIQRLRPETKVKQLQCVHFRRPEPRCVLTPLTHVNTPIVPVVLAADNAYVPQVATTVFSLLAHASRERHYDITILHHDISWENQEAMRSGLHSFPNFTLRFVNAGSELEKYGLSTNNAHISVETYYRFLIPDVLPFYDKVLYLDSDMVVLADVAELYDTDLRGYAIAAVRDIDFAGNVNVKHSDRARYAHTVLKMRDPFSYFQAGVLIFDTAVFRRDFSFEQWMKLASDDRYIYNDQDVLNSQLEGRVLFLPMVWNVMHNVDYRVERLFSQAPAAQYLEYQSARAHPKIIHYAGYIKPWTVVTCDFATFYWKYARQTPFYEVLIRAVATAGRQEKRADTFWTLGKNVADRWGLRKMADVVLPAGTHRRASVKKVVNAIRPKH
ncbi:MAG: DUF4422 domain-containing protein [Arcanobacterium sp.]|nr:DUF4422 domain-containing protein [Arcanobacterium sp.]